ncbi:MAG: hypothetical protein IPL61_12025 [Myxococcales bacterium]|nr:hypothetical protein [Myxococcales bacterium]
MLADGGSSRYWWRPRSRPRSRTTRPADAAGHRRAVRSEADAAGHWRAVRPQPQRRPLARCPDAQLLPCPRRDAAAPAALTTVLTRAFLRRLPSLDADVGAVAGAVIGTGRDDAGLSASGATGVDSHWTVDGAPIDAPYTGGLPA